MATGSPEQHSRFALSQKLGDVFVKHRKVGLPIKDYQFWNYYRKLHGSLPNPEDYGLETDTNPASLIRLFPDEFKEVLIKDKPHFTLVISSDQEDDLYEKEVQSLREAVVSLLVDYHGQLNLSAFWNNFQSKFGSLPDVRKYKLPKKTGRLELLKLLSSSCEIFGTGKNQTVKLLHNGKQNSSVRNTQAPARKEDLSQLLQEQLDIAQMSHRPQHRAQHGQDSYPNPFMPPNQPNLYPPQRNFYDNFYEQGNQNAAQHGNQAFFQNTPQPYQNMPPNRGHNTQHGNYGNHGNRRAANRGPQVSVTKEQLENVAADCIQQLAESKEYVSPERIEKLILQHYKIQSISQLEGIRDISHITAVHEHNRKLSKVHKFIQILFITCYNVIENL